MIRARYLIETPEPPEKVAAIMAGEQSCGTFTRVAGETDALRERFAAQVLRVEPQGSAAVPTLHSAWVARRGASGPFHRAEIEIAYPEANVGRNLPCLAATVAGNLYDLGEVTGLKLLDVTLERSYRDRFPRPALGVVGMRDRLAIPDRPLFGTIIKPNIGLSPGQIAELVEQLCNAGVDFIKDDEIVGNPDSAPVAERVRAVMDRLRRYRDRTGREVMMAFNVTDSFDAMCGHVELIEAEGGNCAMVSLNWCGLSAVEALRARTPLALHGHRNGYGGFGRHPLLGMGFGAYQALFRLTGIDHLHVHGMGGKFADSDEEVAEAARRCLTPMSDADDRVLPVFSSGQWAGTLPHTATVTGSGDFLFMAGGGVLAHPDGPAAGVRSLREAWEAVAAGEPLEGAAAVRPALGRALAHFGHLS